MIRFVFCAMPALLAPLPLVAQTVVYVDPVNGVDRPGNGGTAAPMKTLTFAVTQARGNSIFRLRRGDYDAASGEVFPIDLPDVCTVEGDPANAPPGSGLVSFRTTLELTATLRLAPGAAGQVTLRGLRLGGGQFRAVQLNAGSSGSAQLVVDRCTMTQSRCIAVNASGTATTTVAVLDSDLHGVDTPILVNAADRSIVQLGVDRSRVEGGLAGAVVLDASAGGSIVADLRNTLVGVATRAGVLARTDGRGRVATRIEHCLIHDVGRNVIGGSPGGIVDVVGGSGQPPLHTVVNSIFHANRDDAPGGAAASYTWGVNLVTQASLGGIGGNRIGTATFVDEAGADYHLTPTSLGRDLGRAADVTAAADFDGDPRQLGPPDLGPDEAAPLYLAAATTAAAGQRYTLRALHASGTAFALFLASDRRPGSFGAGQLHLAGTIVATGLGGVTDSRGVGTAAFAVPGSRALLGRTVHWQAGFAAAPFLGSNARSTVIGRR